VQSTVPTAAGFAVVEVVAHSANGRSQLTMQLWLEPDQITTDFTGLEHFTCGGDDRAGPGREFPSGRR
jgi:hypothetical protein